MKARLLACFTFAATLATVTAAHATTMSATLIDVGRGDVAGPGFDASTPVKNGDRADPGNALGDPDQIGNSEGGFFSLGKGGVAVFGFGADFGQSVTVFEVTFGCTGAQQPGGLCSYSELADIYALSGDYTPFNGAFGLTDLEGLGFEKVGAIPNGVANEDGGATISIDGPFSVLALVDVSEQAGDGFDVDSVKVSTAAVPVPASLPLLVSAMIGFGLLSRRRARK